MRWGRWGARWGAGWGAGRTLALGSGSSAARQPASQLWDPMAPSAPKVHFGAKSSPILPTPMNSSMQPLPGAHFFAPKVEKVQKVHFFRKSALSRPQIVDLTWENIRAGAHGSLGAGKVHFSGKSAKSAF